MICQDCGIDLFTYPCVCGAGESVQQEGKRLPSLHIYTPLQGGSYLTKEEFGITLYEAITTLGGMLGLERQRITAMHRGRGYTIQALTCRRAKLVTHWAHIRAVLGHEERMEIMRQYPWARDL